MASSFSQLRVLPKPKNVMSRRRPSQTTHRSTPAVNHTHFFFKALTTVRHHLDHFVSLVHCLALHFRRPRAKILVLSIAKCLVASTDPNVCDPKDMCWINECMNDIVVSSLISKQQEQGDLSCFVWRLAKPVTVHPPASNWPFRKHQLKCCRRHSRWLRAQILGFKPHSFTAYNPHGFSEIPIPHP